MVQRTCRQAGRSSHRSQSWWVDCGRKKAQATRLPEFQKKWDSESYPESYPNHASNFPSLNHGTFAKSGLVFCEHFFLRNYSPQATPPAASEKNPTAAPCTAIHSKQHPAQAPCSGTPTSPQQSANTTLTAHAQWQQQASFKAFRVWYSYQTLKGQV